MQPNELADATAVLLKTLREQLTASGPGSETLGVVQTRLLRGYLEECVALHGDPVLSGVLRDFPERPTLHDAVSVLEQMARVVRPTQAQPQRRETPTAARTSPPTDAMLGPTLADEVRTKMLQPLGATLRERLKRIRQDMAKGAAPTSSPSNAPTLIASPAKTVVDPGAPLPENAFEAEKRLWLATIPQELGTWVDDEVARKPSDVQGLVRLRRMLGVFLVGLAAGLGTGAPVGLFSIPKWHAEEGVAFVGTVLFWMFASEVYVPWMRRWASRWRWRIKRGLPPLQVRHHQYPLSKRIPGRLVVGFLIGFAVEALAHVSGEGTTRPVLLSNAALAAIVTWFWMSGTEAQPRQAAVLGAKSGVIAGCLLGYVVPLVWAPAVRVDIAFPFILTSGLRGGLLGFAGGLALDRGWGAQPRGMLKSLLAAALVWHLLTAPLRLGGSFAAHMITLLSALSAAAAWAIGVSDWQLRSPLQILTLRRATSGEASAPASVTHQC